MELTENQFRVLFLVFAAALIAAALAFTSRNVGGGAGKPGSAPAGPSVGEELGRYKHVVRDVMQRDDELSTSYADLNKRLKEKTITWDDYLAGIELTQVAGYRDILETLKQRKTETNVGRLAQEGLIRGFEQIHGGLADMVKAGKHPQREQIVKASERMKAGGDEVNKTIEWLNRMYKEHHVRR